MMFDTTPWALTLASVANAANKLTALRVAISDLNSRRNMMMEVSGRGIQTMNEGEKRIQLKG